MSSQSSSVKHGLPVVVAAFVVAWFSIGLSALQATVNAPASLLHTLPISDSIDLDRDNVPNHLDPTPLVVEEVEVVEEDSEEDSE